MEINQNEKKEGEVQDYLGIQNNLNQDEIMQCEFDKNDLLIDSFQVLDDEYLNIQNNLETKDQIINTKISST